MGNCQKRPACDASESSDSNDASYDKVSLTAIRSFESHIEGDLSFCKGDLLYLLHESSSCWWYAEDQHGRKGYIPKNFVRKHTVHCTEEQPLSKWYAGKVTRAEAEQIVLATGCSKGTFLVREREANPREWALTVRDTDSSGMPTVKHYRIKRTEDGNLFITEKDTFSDVQKLVEYYSKKSHGLCCKLKSPASRIPPTVSLPSHAVETVMAMANAIFSGYRQMFSSLMQKILVWRIICGYDALLLVVIGFRFAICAAYISLSLLVFSRER